MIRYSQENFPKILEIAESITAIGKRHGATASQVTLAWILAQGDDFIPIPGTKSVKVSPVHILTFMLLEKCFL
jgi:aryl-alcohol dehydrogenase-like predicted oxidoreductase